MEGVFPKLNRQGNAYQEVAESIRTEILKGRLTLGQRLPSEQELAVQFGISRTVVREAIRTLEGTGFVTVKKGQRGGVFVAQDYDKLVIDSIGNMVATGEVTFDDLFAVRSLVECYAVEQLALHGSEDDFSRLKALLDDADKALANSERIRPFNIRFHRMIARLCRNSLLAIIGETAVTVVTSELASIVSRETSLAHLSMHRELLAAIMAGDAELAKTLVNHDINSLKDLMGEKLPQLLRATASTSVAQTQAQL